MAATRLIGPLGEELVLCNHVSPPLKVAKWLAAIEQSMKSTVQFALEDCLRARLEDGKFFKVSFSNVCLLIIYVLNISRDCLHCAYL